MANAPDMRRDAAGKQILALNNGDFDTCVVEARTASEVSQVIGRERVGGVPIERVMAPQSFGKDRHSWLDVGVANCLAANFTELIEYPHCVTLCDSTNCGILRVELERNLAPVELAQR